MVATSDSDYCISLDLKEACGNTSLAPLLASERGRDAGADVADESGRVGNRARQDKKTKSHDSKDGQWRKMLHDILRDNGVRLIAPSELQTIAVVGRGGCKLGVGMWGWGVEFGQEERERQVWTQSGSLQLTTSP